MDMRKVESEGMITVTPRQLEGLVRLATARARLLLKDRVEAEDASRAIYLVDSMMKTAGVDVNTGKTDLQYLLIADNPPVDIWQYPDSNKWGFNTPRKIFRPAEVDYWDGEE